MEKLFKANLLATKHLLILDKVLRLNYSPYAEWASRLEQVPLYDELRKEIYAGGIKERRKGYARQMILGDLIEYILTGRGYYFAVKGNEEFKAFIEILLLICNMLILMEDISVDRDLRNLILDELSSSKGLGNDFFEEGMQKIKFLRLKDYTGRICRGEGKEYEQFFDSILPKRVGIAPELLVYSWFIRKKYGYILPLLLNQRILGNYQSITAPDFLLLRSKGEIFGLEVGAGKERQIASFSSITGIPVFTVGIGSIEHPQPFRCDKCLRWIIYCPNVITICKENLDKLGQIHLQCVECASYKDLNEIKAKCPYIVYYGEAYNYANEVARRRYHYHCVIGDPYAKQRLEENPEEGLIAPLPTVYGVEHLSEEF